MRRTENQPQSSLKSRLGIAGRLAGVVACAGVIVLGSVACNSSAASDPTPVKTFKITPASGTATPVPAVTATATVSSSTGTAGSALRLVGQDTKFDQSALTVAAGPVTITFANKDGGIIHNLHVFEGTDAKGKSVDQTELAAGPVEQELKLELAPGTYFFQCDAHPATMKGTLTVR